jgi:PncC family amidohydrolase
MMFTETHCRNAGLSRTDHAAAPVSFFIADYVPAMKSKEEGQKMTDRELKELFAVLRSGGMTVTTAESCTGGLVAGRITDIAGSSDIFRRGWVTYCDEAKHEMIGVDKHTLKVYTAVSRETAAEMAEGAARRAEAQYALSVTGYADGSPEEPERSGHVFIGCCGPDKTEVREFHFAGGTSEVRRQAVHEALKMLADMVKKEN